MNDRVMQFRVGVVVLATMIIAGLMITLHSPLRQDWLPWGAGTYRVSIELYEAPGIAPDTPVRRSGLLIGRVATIDDLHDRIVVHVDIEADRTLYPQYMPTVRTTVLGDATIDFVTRPILPGTEPLQDGAVVKGRVEPNPLEAIAELADLKGDLQTTINSLGRAGDEVAHLARRIDRAFGDETELGRVNRLLEATERAMTELGNAAAAVNEILGDPILPNPSTHTQPHQAALAVYNQPPPRDEVVIEIDATRERLRQGLRELPDAVRDIRHTMERFQHTLDLADTNLRNLEGFTEPLGRRGDQITQSIIDSVEGIERLVEEFTVLSQAINSPTGTIGQLIHNPQLYDNFNRLVANANHVVLRVNDLTKRLQVVAEDARIFMDKVAREPGRVITGGLNPSPIK